MSRSFNVDIRKVRNSNLPVGVRVTALLTCMTLTREYSFPHLKDMLTITCSIEFKGICPQKMTEQQFTDAISFLEAIHNKYLERLHTFEHKRIREKAQGKRQPSHVDLEALYAHDPLPMHKG